ncbi:hypothetical protein BH09ACT12_BH09ACT12_23750 [soil metagenome]
MTWISRRARHRMAAAVAAGVVVYVAAALLQFEPELVAVLLITALALAVVALLRESVNPFAPQWYPSAGSDPRTRGRDDATFADLRLLESHQTARHPDHHLQRRLGVLADRSLRATHGVGLASDEGRAHLGTQVAELLDGPVRRLSPRDIDLCLRTIEEL